MRISFPELTENGEATRTSAGEHFIYGLISDQERTVARYIVSWSLNHPSEELLFDIIFGQLSELKPGEICNAVSLRHNGLGSPSFLNAASRPFAKLQALHCKFPQDLGGVDDVSANSFDTVDFILKHDSRIPESFAERA